MKGKDVYPQFMHFAVTMSAANTLTFSGISVGVSIFDYAAFLISRVEYKLNRASYSELQNSGDQATIAICGSNSVTDIYDTSRPEVYDMVSFVPIASGTPASMILDKAPVVHDFTGEAGGGILVPAQDIYIGMQTAGFGAAGVATGRIYYRAIELAAADYLELAQRLRVLGS